MENKKHWENYEKREKIYLENVEWRIKIDPKFKARHDKEQAWYKQQCLEHEKYAQEEVDGKNSVEEI